MVDPLVARRWSYRGLYLLLALTVFFFKLLPVTPMPRGVPGPDLMLCLTFVWVLRRPDFLPALFIAAVYLLEDLLFLRPPGLWAVIVLLACEFLRGRVILMREMSFLMEWALVALVLIGMLVLNRTVLAIAVVPQVGLGPAVAQVVLTALAYPLVVAASTRLLGVRRPVSGTIDSMGARL
ncbi:rod shape-determining protein MreD [Halodurantibacterium flavum]|uniref:Rod shape-determining protein MreD n=1 Tax=Halodurantibacterium flavum TaxID=1382802 RepID=A0ABW4S799_9RHOB